jgi:hypothetical protein
MAVFSPVPTISGMTGEIYSVNSQHQLNPPGKLTVGIFLWDKHLFFMASSFCHSLVRQIIGELLSK